MPQVLPSAASAAASSTMLPVLERPFRGHSPGTGRVAADAAGCGGVGVGVLCSQFWVHSVPENRHAMLNEMQYILVHSELL